MNNTQRNEYLAAMGIRQWVLRDKGLSDDADTAIIASPSDDDRPVASLEWTALQERVAGCDRCALHSTRTQTVFGTGNRSADWLIIGEAPGADEDRQGEPFVGRAGQLLTEMLRSTGLERDAVYITNILKCRPPNNRDPQPDEVSSCHNYLERQINLIKPQLILAVGRIAAHNLLQTDTPVGRLRGRVHCYGPAGIPLVVTYHPAYLLRSPLEKRKSWDDLQLALQIINGQRPKTLPK